MAAIRSLSILVVLALVGASFAVRVNAPCDDRQAQSNFNRNSYTGTWYEIYRYPNFFQRESECVTSEVYVETNEVDMRMYQQMVVFEPDFRIIDSTMLGRVSFPNVQPPVGAFNMSYVGVYDRVNFMVLETDYNDYSIAWSCADNPDGSSEQLAWVFSRRFYLRPAIRAYVEARVDSLLIRGLLRETFSDDFTCLGGEISPAK